MCGHHSSFFIVFFFCFTALSRIFHIYRADSLKLYRIVILFLTIHVSYRGAGIVIPYDMPKSKISIEDDDSFNIFQDHFYTKDLFEILFQRSKKLLKYTDH